MKSGRGGGRKIPAHLQNAGSERVGFVPFRRRKKRGREITFSDQLSEVLQAREAGGGGAAFEAGRG